MSNENEILVRVEGGVGHITLNRPKALNALSHEMALAIEKALDAWRDDDAVKMVLIDAEGEKAFCAGGDIGAMYHSGKAGDVDSSRRFWAEEYRMNAKIGAFPKPYVALMHGIVMGGGVGVSAHGSHRVVTDSTMLAMPECGIGLIPDVGGTWLLARAPGHIGEYLGLTGTRIGAADAILAGFADSYVPAGRWEELKSRLLETADPAIIASFAETAPDGKLAAIQGEIDRVFSAETAIAARDALEGIEAEWAEKALKAIRHGSPISLACTFALVRAARGDQVLAQSLKREYRFTSRSMTHGDLIEGIRAAIIDKDRNPQFSKPGLEAISAGDVAFMLSEPEGGDIEI